MTGTTLRIFPDSMIEEKGMQKIKDKIQGTFYGGYVFGVDLYQSYFSADYEMRTLIRSIIDNVKPLARRGDWFFKGVMTGYHDAAEERKAKQIG